MDEFVSSQSVKNAVKAAVKPVAKSKAPLPLTTERLQAPNMVVGGASKIINYAWTAPQLLGLLGGIGGFIAGKPAEEGQALTTRQKIGGAMQKPSRFMAQPTGELINENILGGVADVAGRFQNAWGKLTNAPARADRYAADIKNKLGQIGNAEGLSSGITTNLVAARDALTANNGKAFETAFEAAQNALQAEKKQGAGFWKSLTSGNFSEWNERRKHNGELEKAYKKATQPINQSAYADADAAFWQNPTQAIKERLKNQSLQETVYDVARYGSIGLQVYGQARETKASYATLKQLYADLTGAKAKDVGFFALVKGYFSSSTPAFLKNAIGHYFKTTLASWGFLTASAVAQEKLHKTIVKRGGSGMQAMFASMAVFKGLNFLEDKFARPDAAVVLYESLRNMQAENMTIFAGRAPDMPSDYPTQPNYADLIVTAIPALKSNTAIQQREVSLVATYFEAHQTPVAEVMKVLAGGKQAVVKLSETAYDELVVQPQKAEEASAKAPVAEQKAIPSFLQSRKERTIQGTGQHTSKLVNAAPAVQHSK